MKLAPVIALLSSALSVTALSAQTLDPALLLKPPTDNWPTYNGDYSGRRFSTLSRINSSNVTSMTLAWEYRLDPGTAR
jgi:alcohol dehydrogenase (cytochrome c)